VDTETGEVQERRLPHREEAEKFYRELVAQGVKVRVGMEASGQARWFERLLTELQFELWIGDAAEIQSKRVRKQKTDRQDAQLILKLMGKDDFPQIWVPSRENRDVRQLLWHRHRMVQARTRIMNQLQALALNEGVRCKKRLWREQGRQQLESFRLAPWASRRRRDLLELLDRLNPSIAELSQAIEQEADRRRLGHITKQGSSMVRFLLVEAAQVTVRSLPEWRSQYVHLVMRRGRKTQIIVLNDWRNIALVLKKSLSWCLRG
jgi:transposase